MMSTLRILSAPSTYWHSNLETKPTNEAMDLDEEENKRKRLRSSNNKNGDSQQKMVLDDLSDSDKDENITIAQIAKKSKADSSTIAPPKSDSKPPSLSKYKVMWEPPNVFCRARYESEK